MNNSELLQKYVNKYLTESDKWKIISALLKKHNKIKDKSELKKIVQKDLLNLSHADACYFVSGKVTNITGEIMVPVATSNGHSYGTIILKSSQPHFCIENSCWIQIVADNIALMLENIELIEDLKRKNQEQMDFLASVSHEFKTPLNSIMGFTELLKKRVTFKENYKYLNNISLSSKFLMALIQDILDVTRSKYKKIELNKEIFSPSEEISNILLGFEEQIREKKLSVNETYMSCVILADIKRFRQLIYNLISNAIKFNRSGGEIKLITYVENSQFVFEITDTGDGICKKDYQKIFGFFTQANKNSFKRQLGSGIGLALCKAIIESNGGEINFSSKLHKGSTFWFKLPKESLIS